MALGIQPTLGMINNPNFDFINSTETNSSLANLVHN